MDAGNGLKWNDYKRWLRTTLSTWKKPETRELLESRSQGTNSSVIRNRWISNILEFVVALRTNLFQAATIGLFSLGFFLGIVAVTMWQQWSLTFGQDPEFLLAVSCVLCFSLWLGQHWQRMPSVTSRGRSLVPLVLSLAFCSVLHPFWIDTLTRLMVRVPISWLENSNTKLMLITTLAGLGWLIPGMLWSAIFAHEGIRPGRSASSNRLAFSTILSGIAFGLLLNVLVLSPWLGFYIPTICAALTASIVSSLFRRGARSRKAISSTEILASSKESSHADDSSAPGRHTGQGRDLSNEDPLLARRADEARSEQRIGATLVRIGMACLVGGLLACNLRLVNQLMPHSAFTIYVQIAGVIFGMAFGLFLASFQNRTSDRAAWGGLFASAACSLLLALQPILVDLSLWMNSSISTVAFLLAARVALLITVACPFGLAIAWVADSSGRDFRATFIAWVLPFGSALGTATFALSGFVDLFPLMAVCSGLLVLAAGFLRIRWSVPVFSLRTAIYASCLVATSLSLPLWRSCDDPSRTAKLLFSTPTFIAYRSGWEIEQLPFLDDVRMIDRKEGRTGPLTLWRGHVAELYVREAGIPRAVVTKHSDLVPQFAPEVLQAVYSLVLSDRPNRVLLLGLSTGVPLSTCLGFPIQEAICIEGDSNLIDFVRGPLKREIGYDPLTDDRVSLRHVSPELGLMAQASDPFDVILSCPSASSMTGDAASFTREFYQRAARQLAERGLFCQRFECVDYGPEPLQMVLKSMRTAFQKVIAIETSAGELLLFGANSGTDFVPRDLVSRLEMSHVRRTLARCGLDWSVLLNQATFDHDALGEVCNDSRCGINTAFNGYLSARAPIEVMRWGNKVQEVQTLLTSTRTTPAPFWTENAKRQPNWVDNEIQLSRRSRLVEWLDEDQASRELMRRLEEVVTQQKLVRENPDDHWYKYRRTLRKQLQERPRTAVQQVKAIDEKRTLHPEDIRRRDYFVAFAKAATQKKPTREQIAAVEKFLEPYDPLLSYFARQEIAEQLAKSGEDAAQELSYRLHVIYFAPALDASVRNVAKALDTLVKHPEAIPDDSIRFDALNGLIQTLRVRWEIRQTIREDSSRKILEDVDQSLLAVQKGVTSLDGVYASAGVSEREWQTRKQVIERLMLRPLRDYRKVVHGRQTRSQAQTDAILSEATNADDDEE